MVLVKKGASIGKTETVFEKYEYALKLKRRGGK